MLICSLKSPPSHTLPVYREAQTRLDLTTLLWFRWIFALLQVTQRIKAGVICESEAWEVKPRKCLLSVNQACCLGFSTQSANKKNAFIQNKITKVIELGEHLLYSFVHWLRSREGWDVFFTIKEMCYYSNSGEKRGMFHQMKFANSRT